MEAKKLTIGVITPYMDGHYFGSLLLHIQRFARHQGIRMIVVSALSDDNHFNLPLAANQADGWIAIKHPVNPELLDNLVQRGKKIVGIGHESVAYPCAFLDNRLALADSTEHLIQHGHRRIAFVGNLKNENFILRHEGYKDALRKFGIEYDPHLTINVTDSALKGSIDAAEQLLRLDDPCTAAVTCSAFMTISMINKLRSNGILVPQDLAVMSFDDTPREQEFRPALTTMRNQTELMARHAVELLLKQIREDQYLTEQVALPATLVVRESCGCGFSEEQEAATNVNHSNIYGTMENAIEVSRQLSRLMAAGDSKNIYNLSWLKHVRIPWACFATADDYNEAAEPHSLNIASIITEWTDTQDDIGVNFRYEDFPGKHLIPDEAYRDEHEDVLALFPILSANRNWGVLATIQRIDEQLINIKSNTTTYAYVLFGAALERLKLFEQNQKMIGTLEIISDLTNDAIFDLNLSTDRLEWNYGKAGVMLNISTSADLSSFLRQVHPEDMSLAEDVFSIQNQKVRGNQSEFRIGNAFGEYIWIEVSSKAVSDSSGALAHLIGCIRDITDRKRSQEQIHYMAFHDNLTGLPNRAFFLQRLNEEIDHARRHGHMLAVLLIDLDRFKSINDNYGHHMGDLVLKHAAGLLQKVASNNGMVSRHGGDEFMMMLPSIKNRSMVDELCKRIADLFRIPFIHDCKQIQISGCVGYNLFPDDGDGLDALINNADAAMYRAKSNGRNRYTSYASDEHA